MFHCNLRPLDNEMTGPNIFVTDTPRQLFFDTGPLLSSTCSLVFQTNMHASFPYDAGRNGGGGGGGGGNGRGVEYGTVRRPDALLPPPGLDQTDLVLHTSLVDDPQVSDDVRNQVLFLFAVSAMKKKSSKFNSQICLFSYVLLLQNTNVDDGGFMNDLPLLKSEYHVFVVFMFTSFCLRKKLRSENYLCGKLR